MVTENKQSIAIIGLNHITLPVAQDFMKDDMYLIRVFTANVFEENSRGHEPPISEFIQILKEMTEPLLEQSGAFNADILVLATMDDAFNIHMARKLKARF